MSFRIRGIDPAPIRPLFSLPDDELQARGMQRVIASAAHGYPCRVSLVDAAIGEELILLPYDHQPARSPYQARGPIFVRRDAGAPVELRDTVPDYLATRLLSVRAYDANDEMVDAEVVDGREARDLLERFLALPTVAYLHVHFARRGCFGCRVERG